MVCKILCHCEGMCVYVVGGNVKIREGVGCGCEGLEFVHCALWVVGVGSGWGGILWLYCELWRIG